MAQNSEQQGAGKPIAQVLSHNLEHPGAGKPNAQALSSYPPSKSRQQGVGGSSDYHKTSDSVRAWKYEMRGHARQCVDRYLELSGKTKKDFKQVATPCMDDHQFNPQDFITKGHLGHLRCVHYFEVRYCEVLQQ